MSAVVTGRFWRVGAPCLVGVMLLASCRHAAPARPVAQEEEQARTRDALPAMSEVRQVLDTQGLTLLAPYRFHDPMDARKRFEAVAIRPVELDGRAPRELLVTLADAEDVEPFMEGAEDGFLSMWNAPLVRHVVLRQDEGAWRWMVTIPEEPQTTLLDARSHIQAVDLDGDGRQELLVTVWDEEARSARIYQMDEQGHFQDRLLDDPMASALLVTPTDAQGRRQVIALPHEELSPSGEIEPEAHQAFTRAAYWLEQDARGFWVARPPGDTAAFARALDAALLERLRSERAPDLRTLRALTRMRRAGAGPRAEAVRAALLDRYLHTGESRQRFHLLLAIPFATHEDVVTFCRPILESELPQERHSRAACLGYLSESSEVASRALMLEYGVGLLRESRGLDDVEERAAFVELLREQGVLRDVARAFAQVEDRGWSRALTGEMFDLEERSSWGELLLSTLLEDDARLTPDGTLEVLIEALAGAIRVGDHEAALSLGETLMHASHQGTVRRRGGRVSLDTAWQARLERLVMARLDLEKLSPLLESSDEDLRHLGAGLCGLLDRQSLARCIEPRLASEPDRHVIDAMLGSIHLVREEPAFSQASARAALDALLDRERLNPWLLASLWRLAMAGRSGEELGRVWDAHATDEARLAMCEFMNEDEVLRGALRRSGALSERLRRFHDATGAGAPHRASTLTPCLELIGAGEEERQWLLARARREPLRVATPMMAQLMALEEERVIEVIVARSEELEQEPERFGALLSHAAASAPRFTSRVAGEVVSRRFPHTPGELIEGGMLWGMAEMIWSTGELDERLTRWLQEDLEVSLAAPRPECLRMSQVVMLRFFAESPGWEEELERVERHAACREAREQETPTLLMLDGIQVLIERRTHRDRVERLLSWARTRRDHPSRAVRVEALQVERRLRRVQREEAS